MNQRATLSDESDEMLMQHIAKSHAVAFEVLVNRHLPIVLRVAVQRLGNPAEAEEIAQEVFAKIWTSAALWEKQDAKFTTWLYRVTVNRTIDALRRRKPTAQLDELPEIPDDSEDSFEIMARRDQTRLIRTALEELTPNQRDAIELVYFSEMKQLDAAEALGLSVAALESTLRRARGKLHEILSRHQQLISINEDAGEEAADGKDARAAGATEPDKAG